MTLTVATKPSPTLTTTPFQPQPSSHVFLPQTRRWVCRNPPEGPHFSKRSSPCERNDCFGPLDWSESTDGISEKGNANRCCTVKPLTSVKHLQAICTRGRVAGGTPAAWGEWKYDDVSADRSDLWPTEQKTPPEGSRCGVACGRFGAGWKRNGFAFSQCSEAWLERAAFHQPGGF